MKKPILIEEEFEDDVNFIDVVDTLLEDDEISAAEAAFMRGFEEAG